HPAGVDEHEPAGDRPRYESTDDGGHAPPLANGARDGGELGDQRGDGARDVRGRYAGHGEPSRHRTLDAHGEAGEDDHDEEPVARGARPAEPTHGEDEEDHELQAESEGDARRPDDAITTGTDE